MCAWRHAESDFGQAGLDREAGQPAVAVDDEQDRATLVHGDEDDEGVGAGKAAAARGEAPDGNARRRHDDNQGVPACIECLRMTAGRGTLPEPHHAPW